MNDRPAEGSNRNITVEASMKAKRIILALAVVGGLSGFAAVVHAQETRAAVQSPQTFPGSKYSLAPLPVEIYTQSGERPTVAFSTPCIQIERMTNGFPPILAFETFMFSVIGNVNELNVLPIQLEPVCI
jgi:hypothetical protein